MDNPPTDEQPGAASPFATGGGGESFERLVGVSYLSSLLAAEIPRGLDRGILRSVAFQQRWSGAVLDDVVAISVTSDGTIRRLYLQVKHDLTFSDAPSNNLFKRVISDCWSAFTGRFGTFDVGKDRLGIAIGVYQAMIDQHLQRLLDWARTSATSLEFVNKVDERGFCSDEMRHYRDVFRSVLSTVNLGPISDEQLWTFLKSLVVLHYDVMSAGSRDLVHAENTLLGMLRAHSDNQAQALFNSLLSIVSKYAPSGGTLTAGILRDEIGPDVQLRDAPDCSADLARLRQHTELALHDVTISIGEQVHLPRQQLMNEALDSLRNNQVLLITGEPGMGKSALLGLLVNHLRQEGEILVTSMGRLTGASLDEYVANLQIQNELRVILSAAASAPLRL